MNTRSGGLGRVYQDGDIIVRQGETGEHMYVIQSGSVDVVQEQDGDEVKLSQLGDGDIFGEMALFEKTTRSATVRAVGEVRVLTVDKKAFLKRVHEDPSLAYRILKHMSQRIRAADSELVRLSRKGGD